MGPENCCVVGIDCPKSSSVPGPDVDAEGPALNASDCPAASTFCGGAMSSDASMLTSGITAARHTLTAAMLAIREIEGRRGMDPGYAAVPHAALPMRPRDRGHRFKRGFSATAVRDLVRDAQGGPVRLRVGQRAQHGVRNVTSRNGQTTLQVLAISG